MYPMAMSWPTDKAGTLLILDENLNSVDLSLAEYIHLILQHRSPHTYQLAKVAFKSQHS